MKALAHSRDPRPRGREQAADIDLALTREQAVTLAERYVGAYNDRDLEAMLAVQDAAVVSYPSRLAGAAPHQGHDGVRAWWEQIASAGQWYEVRISEVRQPDADRVVVLGEIYDCGEHVSPWCVVLRVRKGLIIESRSYLSERALLDELGVIA